MIKTDPKNAEAYNNLGLIYHGRGEYSTAILAYNKAIKLNPKFATAYHNCGNAYKNNDEKNKAVADFKKARELGY